MRTPILVTLFATAAVAVGLAGDEPSTARRPAPGWVAAERVPEGQSLVLVHNASGRTLFGGAQVVNFDGRKVAKLARGEYTAVVLAPGEHQGWVGSFRKQRFATAAGRATHWVVAYSPAKGWAAPFAGKSFAYGVVPDSLGRALAAGHEWVEPLVPLPAMEEADSARGGR